MTALRLATLPVPQPAWYQAWLLAMPEAPVRAEVLVPVAHTRRMVSVTAMAEAAIAALSEVLAGAGAGGADVDGIAAEARQAGADLVTTWIELREDGVDLGWAAAETRPLDAVGADGDEPRALLAWARRHDVRAVEGVGSSVGGDDPFATVTLRLPCSTWGHALAASAELALELGVPPPAEPFAGVLEQVPFTGGEVAVTAWLPSSGGVARLAVEVPEPDDTTKLMLADAVAATPLDVDRLAQTEGALLEPPCARAALAVMAEGPELDLIYAL